MHALLAATEEQRAQLFKMVKKASSRSALCTASITATRAQMETALSNGLGIVQLRHFGHDPSRLFFFSLRGAPTPPLAVMGHAYAIVKVLGVRQIPLLQLRNPW